MHFLVMPKEKICKTLNPFKSKLRSYVFWFTESIGNIFSAISRLPPKLLRVFATSSRIVLVWEETAIVRCQSKWIVIKVLYSCHSRQTVSIEIGFNSIGRFWNGHRKVKRKNLKILKCFLCNLILQVSW